MIGDELRKRSRGVAGQPRNLVGTVTPWAAARSGLPSTTPPISLLGRPAWRSP
jgi:hypothetical protein